jgi:glycosyltransferase involved in cell wall biosynthesis
VPAVEHPPICVLLLPAPLERFILRDQAEDLLRADGVIAADPPRMPYGAFGRMPLVLGDALAARQARRLVRTLRRRVGDPRVVVIFHALQYQLGRAVAAQTPGAELWYWRWDRYERAYDASPRLRERLELLHEQAAERAAMVIAVSDELVRIEGVAGRKATLVPLAADAFPAPRGGEVVAISLGHLGWRTDWSLLRAVGERLGDRLVLLLAGEVHDDECRDDPDFLICRRAPNLVFLGRVDDEPAARLVLTADVGIVPFKVEPFNDAGLPYRILKYARLGRRTVTPDLAGVRTWADAVTVADGPEAFADALLAQAGARARPDEALRAWALAQTARTQDEPLWQRLAELGVDTRVSR